MEKEGELDEEDLTDTERRSWGRERERERERERDLKRQERKGKGKVLSFYGGQGVWK